MSQKIQLRRGTDTERTGVTFASGEPVWTTDTNSLYIGDGITLGGLAVGGGGGVSWPLVSTDGNLSFGSNAGTTAWINDDGSFSLASGNTHGDAYGNMTIAGAYTAWNGAITIGNTSGSAGWWDNSGNMYVTSFNSLGSGTFNGYTVGFYNGSNGDGPALIVDPNATLVAVQSSYTFQVGYGAGVGVLLLPTGEVNINGDSGTAGYVLTSQGIGSAAIWAAGGGSLTLGTQFLTIASYSGGTLELLAAPNTAGGLVTVGGGYDLSSNGTGLGGTIDNAVNATTVTNGVYTTDAGTVFIAPQTSAAGYGITNGGSLDTLASSIVAATADPSGFNGVSQLVLLNGSGQYPALDGSLITGVAALPQTAGLSSPIINSDYTTGILSTDGSNGDIQIVTAAFITTVIGVDAHGSSPYLQGFNGPTPADLLGFDINGNFNFNGHANNAAGGLVQLDGSGNLVIGEVTLVGSTDSSYTLSTNANGIVFSSGAGGIEYVTRLTDGTNANSVDVSNRVLYGSDGTTPNLNWATPGVIFPPQSATAPTYVEGGMYYDTTMKKLYIGGATGWEMVTSI